MAGQTLRRAGFFRELPGENAQGKSLHAAMRPWPGALEPKVVHYLRGGLELVHDERLVPDVVDVDAPPLGSRSVRTDGVWAWPDALASLVEHHHVRVPAPFAAHMERNGWMPPGRLDVTGFALGGDDESGRGGVSRTLEALERLLERAADTRASPADRAEAAFRAQDIAERARTTQPLSIDESVVAVLATGHGPEVALRAALANRSRSRPEALRRAVQLAQKSTPRPNNRVLCTALAELGSEKELTRAMLLDLTALDENADLAKFGEHLVAIARTAGVSWFSRFADEAREKLGKRAQLLREALDAADTADPDDPDDVRRSLVAALEPV